jgi:hypothetical protein
MGVHNHVDVNGADHLHLQLFCMCLRLLAKLLSLAIQRALQLQQQLCLILQLLLSTLACSCLRCCLALLCIKQFLKPLDVPLMLLCKLLQRTGTGTGHSCKPTYQAKNLYLLKAFSCN